jgi:heme/copper-type cytochrome/quinol oxidase subunit 1
MFSKISWQGFMAAIAVLLFIYYMVIALLYYRRDIARLSRNGFKKSAHQKQTPDPAVSKTENDQTLFSSVHELMDELKTIFTTAAERKFPKQELLMALQSKLKSYAPLKDTFMRSSINYHIVQESQIQCGFAVDEFELSQLW